MTRVLLADDHAPTREEIRYALELDSSFKVVAEAADAPSAIEAAMRERPDLCVLDIHMPGGGIQATWEIRARLPQASIVMLTMSSDDDDLFGALRAGADGYLLKDIDPRRLPRALQSVLDGEVALPRALVAKVVHEFRDRNTPRRRVLASPGTEALTSREWEVLDLLKQELTTAEVARRLMVSEGTVRSHVMGMMRKLKVSSREELLREYGAD